MNPRRIVMSSLFGFSDRQNKIASSLKPMEVDHGSDPLQKPRFPMFVFPGDLSNWICLPVGIYISETVKPKVNESCLFLL